MGADFPSESVVEAVSRETGIAPLDLPPLYETIDPDALDDLLNGRGGDAAVDRVQFDYAGQSVTVTGDGTIDVVGAASVDQSGTPTGYSTDR